MKHRPESVDPTRVLGYLGSDDVLYCSDSCAAERGQQRAVPVDHDEYPALLQRGIEARGGQCPVCGSEFPLDWSPDER